MQSFKILVAFFICSYFNTYGQSIYTNDMDYVLGDAKQAFITGKITTTDQADNLLKGFKEMKVNGIRIPIFARNSSGIDVNPNKPMMDYFYQQAVAQGFLIYANPAQSSGGQRIANGVLNGATSPVKDDQSASEELILRVLEFSAQYPNCKWINPFNEDGRATSSTWSVNQYHFIYGALYANLFNMELIGPCTWGIPAGIDMLQNTNIEDYITVAATHNLGFNHSQWSSFINLAKEKNLPVWDSEVNHYDKYGTGTRLEKAIEYKVDGLVLYDSWNTISLTDGTISTGAKNQMLLYLKQNLSSKTQDQIELSIYPNPIEDILNVVSTDVIFTKYSIHNVNGQLIDSNDLNAKQLTINTSNYSRGVYVLNLEGANFSGSYKIVKK